MNVVSPETVIAVSTVGSAPTRTVPFALRHCQFRGSSTSSRLPRPTQVAVTGTVEFSRKISCVPSVESSIVPPAIDATSPIAAPAGMEIPSEAVKTTAWFASDMPSEFTTSDAFPSSISEPVMETPAGMVMVTFSRTLISPRDDMAFRASDEYANVTAALPSPRPQSNVSESACGATSNVSVGLSPTIVKNGFPNLP